MPYSFGKTMLVVNPAAQIGRGQSAGEAARQAFAQAGITVSVCASEGSAHARELGKRAADEHFDTVCALGGDGIIHHVAEGLMDAPAEDRPVLGVIPVGSGNDFAKTLGIPVGVDNALPALLAAEPRELDVVRVNDEHYVETLSFGLDAAIALGTEERRRRTGETGLRLYFMTGVDEILHRMYSYTYHAVLEGVDGVPGARCTLDGKMKLCAVQNGRTYGGGFPITPDARPDDGLVNICIARGDVGKLRTLITFAKATKGRHVSSPFVEFYRAQRVQISFIDEGKGLPACQFDGEPCPASFYDIEVQPRQLRVLSCVSWEE